MGKFVLGDSQTWIKQYGQIYLNSKIDEIECAIESIIVDQLTNDLLLELDFLRKF